LCTGRMPVLRQGAATIIDDESQRFMQGGEAGGLRREKLTAKGHRRKERQGLIEC